MYFSPRCLFCDKNNGRRHTRRGRTWQCKHCGEMNPGPGMLKAIVGRFTTPPADAKHLNGAAQPAAAAPPARAAATTIKGVAKAPAVKPPAKPAAESTPASKAQPKPSAPSTPPPPVKKGILEQVAARVYG